jgi:hypothetical protein
MSFEKTLRRTTINALDRFVDTELNKVSGVNKPFKSIQRTDDYKKFESMFAEGINDQGKWVSDNIEELFKSAGIDDNLESLALDQRQKLHGQISRDMPSLDAFVSEFKSFQLLKNFFEWSAVQQYRRWGYIAKSTIEFKLTNQSYIKTLTDRASYLLNQSSLDSTTIDQVIDIISEARLNGMTNSEVAQFLSDRFDEISRYRADMITRTEAANSMGMANHATAKENGAQTKSWISAGEGDDEICAGNADDGEIPIDQAFSSGAMHEPGHPNCECYTEAGLIDLDSVELWTGE